MAQCYICNKEETEQVKLAICTKCGNAYCTDNASKIDTSKCEKCCSEVVVEDTIFVRTEEEYDEIRDTLTRHTQKARQIKFAGADWVWHTQAIKNLNDDQLKAAIEFHKATVSMMETEMTQRKIDNEKKKSIVAQVGQTIVSTKRTTEKKTKTVTKQKQLDPAAIAAQLKKAGVNIAQVMAALGVKMPAATPENKEDAANGITSGSK